jgi:hypothetical protein
MMISLTAVLEAEDRPEKLNKSIDAEIADRCPVVFVVALKISGTGDVQLNPIPADMPEQIHQGRDPRIASGTIESSISSSTNERVSHHRRGAVGGGSTAA